MKALKKLVTALALTLIFALSCGAAMADELVIVANDQILAVELVQTWLSELAELGVTTRLVNETDFEAVKTSPYLAVLITHDPAYNLDLLPVVITSATYRMGLEAPGTRKFFSFENKFAQGQVLLVISTARISGMAMIFNEIREEWQSALSGLIQ